MTIECEYFNEGLQECKIAEKASKETSEIMCSTCGMPNKQDRCKHFKAKKTKKIGLRNPQKMKREINDWECKINKKTKTTDYRNCFMNAVNKNECFEETKKKK